MVPPEVAEVIKRRRFLGYRPRRRVKGHVGRFIARSPLIASWREGAKAALQ